MSNAWTVALRPPCAAFCPSSTSQLWKLAARIATGRAFSALSRPRRKPSISDTPHTFPRQQPYRLYLHHTPNSFQTLPRSFRSSAAILHPAPARKPPPKQPSKKRTPAPQPSRPQTPQDELPLPDGPLSSDEIRAIFGPTVPAPEGNQILRILQYRRVSGSLAEYGIADLPGRLPQLTHELVLNALAWLREHYPVDEEGAAVKWAEEEAGRIERELSGETSRESRANGDDQGLQGTEYGRARYGQSVIDAVRKENEAKRELEKKRRELEEKKREAEEVRNNKATAVTAQSKAPKKFLGAELRGNKKNEYVERFKERAQLKFKNEEELFSSLTTFQRLWPTTLFTIAVLSLCAWYASIYVPPDNAVRFMKDYTPSFATALTLLTMNFGFWLMWFWPRAWPFMNKYMTMIPAYPRAFSALGNVFSHQSFKHLVMNMMYLMTIGVWCHDTVGRGTFLATYIAAGTFGSFSSLWYYTLTRNLNSSSIGASGAMLGILSLWCITEDRDRIFIPFTSISVPISPRLFLCAAIAWEIVMMRAGKMPWVDHCSHLGGYAAGIVSGLIWKYGDRFKEWGGGVERENAMTKIGEKGDEEK